MNPKKFDVAVQLGATDCLNPQDFKDKSIQQVRDDKRMYGMKP